MGSNIAEGSYTFHIRKVSELLHHTQDNKRLLDAKSKKIHCWKYGPFTTDVIEWEIRLYPVGDDLKQYLCLLDNNSVVIKKYGFVNLLQSNCKDRCWTMAEGSTIFGHEHDFKADNFGKALGLTMVPLNHIDKKLRRKVCRDDGIDIKLSIWFILDSTWKPDRKICPPGLISTFLKWEFADIDIFVGGKKFRAHMAMLAARSSVFQKELFPLQNKIRQNSLRVSIEHMDALTFKYLLDFIYTDSLPPDVDKDRYRGLFIAARSFNIESLKKICQKKFSTEEINTILSTLGQIGFQNWSKLKIVPTGGNKH